jgi:beta-alanine--pyruvate transaminase
MPFTGNRNFKASPRMMVSAQGAYYTDNHGRKILRRPLGPVVLRPGPWPPRDHRSGEPAGGTLDYSPAFPVWPPAVVRAGQQDQGLTPEGLDYVFFTGSGSESADTSLKMARAYWRAKGQGTKTRLIGREKGYHGVNFGGISVGGIVGNRKTFGQGVEADHLPHTQPPAALSTRACRPRARAGRRAAGTDRTARRKQHRRRHRRALLRLGRRGDSARGLPAAPARDLHRKQHPADF